MLITQGELDYRVPFGESLTTFKLLQRLNVPSRFVMFPDEGHWIQKGPNSRRHMEEVLGWLARHLATPSTASAP
jgi:dipeptidyl aminopeptidase/acylaminoacyl peptidase